MERIICLVIGYACGLIQTGYFYTKAHHVDIRSVGSGNSGSTNVMRTMGAKAGLIVFLGDAFKTLIPCLIVRAVFQARMPEMANLLVLYTAFGTILGHNFPFYLKFKGGKGIASTAGLLAAMDWRVMLICLVAFIIVVAVTRFVSLGSLVVVSLFLIGMIIFGGRGDYGLASRYLTEFYVLSAAVTAMAFWRHKANIVRLIHGNENKISIGHVK